MDQGTFHLLLGLTIAGQVVSLLFGVCGGLFAIANRKDDVPLNPNGAPPSYLLYKPELLTERGRRARLWHFCGLLGLIIFTVAFAVLLGTSGTSRR